MIETPKQTHFFQIQSDRLCSKVPSLWGIVVNYALVFFRTLSVLHSTHVSTLIGLSDDIGSNSGYLQSLLSHSRSQKTETNFAVDCSWTRMSCNAGADYYSATQQKRLAHWLVERYFVYTHKYKSNWIGQVDHEPWPIEEVRLDNLKISGIEMYEPVAMRPILEYMANNPPDSVLFSPGVGPVHFTMLRPV